MQKLHVARSPLTNRIYCGGLSKDGMTWLKNKTDVTADACAAVAQHAIAAGQPLIVSCNGRPAYRITVENLGDPDEIQLA